MLNAARIKNAKPRARAYKLTDALGLYLFVSPAGGKLWRFKYRFGGAEKLLSFGRWPEISLVDARERRDAARKQVAMGIDPGVAKKAEKEAVRNEGKDSVEVVAREWHKEFLRTWSDQYAAAIMDRMERDVFPWLGSRKTGNVTAPDVLKVLKKVEERGALDMAHRVKTIVSQIFRYAVATGRAERDVTVDLRGALPPVNVTHRAALTDPDEVAGLLRAIDGYHGTPVVRAALRLAPMVFVRPGELRKAEWPEMDLDGAVWTIPAVKMKSVRDHMVPLSRQAVEILSELQPLTGGGRYVFPGPGEKGRPMSENAVLKALRRMGYGKEEMTGHGFRAMARTILDEVLQVRPEIIEHQLAHVVRDPLGRAYNRTAHLEDRRRMMQVWADYLDGLRSGKVLEFKRRA